MKTLSQISGTVALAALLAAPSAQARDFTSAEVSRIVNTVNLLLPDQSSRPASLGSVVSGRTAVQTASRSRAQLTFPDESIVRLGANTVFSFEAGDRDVTLDRGTMLLQAPKFRGKTEIKTAAVTAAITGTTILIEFIPPVYDDAGNIVKLGIGKIIVVEGSLEYAFNVNPRKKMRLGSGEMVSFSFPSDARRLPRKFVVDLKRLTTTSLLFDGGLGPLPTLNAVNREVASQQRDLSRGVFVSTLRNARSPDRFRDSGVRDARNSISSAPVDPPPLPPRPRPERMKKRETVRRNVVVVDPCANISGPDIPKECRVHGKNGMDGYGKKGKRK